MEFAKNQHPLWIVGNGPSLKGFNFDKLEGRRWLGMNAAYRHWDRMGHYPTYYCCLDSEVSESHAGDIIRLVERAADYGLEKFLLLDDLIASHKVLQLSDRVVNFSTLVGHDQSISSVRTTGSHALLWGAVMGYVNLTICGVDQNYVEIAPGLKQMGGTRLQVVSKTDSPNYYFADYQRVGDVLNLPNPVPALHKAAWLRVVRYIHRHYPEVRLQNASPVSLLPGVPSVTLLPDMTTTMRSEAAGFEPAAHPTLMVPDGRSFEWAASHLLPPRFVYASGPNTGCLGAGWRRNPPDKVPNAGRWHLSIWNKSHRNDLPRFGSLLYKIDEGSDGDEGLAGLHLEFDQWIGLHRKNAAGPPDLAWLALKLDRINVESDSLSRITPAHTAMHTLKRYAYGCIRRFDSFRSGLS